MGGNMIDTALVKRARDSKVGEARPVAIAVAREHDFGSLIAKSIYSGTLEGSRKQFGFAGGLLDVSLRA